MFSNANPDSSYEIDPKKITKKGANPFASQQQMWTQYSIAVSDGKCSIVSSDKFPTLHDLLQLCVFFMNHVLRKGRKDHVRIRKVNDGKKRWAKLQ